MKTKDPFIDQLHRKLNRLTGFDMHKGLLALMVYTAIIWAAAIILTIIKN